MLRRTPRMCAHRALTPAPSAPLPNSTPTQTRPAPAAPARHLALRSAQRALLAARLPSFGTPAAAGHTSRSGAPLLPPRTPRGLLGRTLLRFGLRGKEAAPDMVTAGKGGSGAGAGGILGAGLGAGGGSSSSSASSTASVAGSSYGSDLAGAGAGMGGAGPTSWVGSAVSGAVGAALLPLAFSAAGVDWAAWRVRQGVAHLLLRLHPA